MSEICNGGKVNTFDKVKTEKKVLNGKNTHQKPYIKRQMTKRKKLATYKQRVTILNTIASF